MIANRLSGFFAVGLALSMAGCGGDSLTLPPTTGTLDITSVTTGPAPDADGYGVSLDGTDHGTIGANASLSVPNLTPGSHVAGLTGVDANCQVEGNLRVITIAAGETQSLTFAVNCAEPPPVVGVLRVTTATSGEGVDPDGYGFAVDGGTPQPIGLNSTTDLANTAAGPHTVVLSNVSSNCTVDDASQGTVVPPGGTATVSFRITCGPAGPTTGSIRVITSTSGPNQDADGYQFAVDGGSSQSIGVSGSQTVSNISPGSHTVVLSGVADNCSVNDASQGVTVAAGQTADVNFAITCSSTGPTNGSIRVTTATTGDNPDADGYQFAIDNGAGQTIGANANQTVGNIPPGSHTVVLSGVAANCAVNDASQGVTVTAGQTADVNFAITCVSTGPSASRSSMRADPKSIPTGGTSTITVTARGANGSPVAGTTVTLSATGSENTITPASATTDARGVATFTFSSTVGEDKTITATAGGVTLQDTEVITVFRRSSSIQIMSDQKDPSSPEETITVVFAVSVSGSGTPTGTVDVFSLEEAGDNAGCTVDVSAGSCSFVLTQPGLHHLQASYSGDGQFEGSLDGEEHTVSPAPAANVAPTANNDPTADRVSLYSTQGGATLTVSAAQGVLQNDSDPDPGTILQAVLTDPANSATAQGGAISLAPDGGFTYTPPPPPFSGTDSFTYEASDGSLASLPATVTIAVQP